MKATYHFHVLCAAISIFALYPIQNANAQTIDWFRQIGSKANDSFCESVTSKNGDKVFVLINFTDTLDIDPGSGITQLFTPSPGFSQTVLVCYSPTGNIIWHKQFWAYWGGGRRLKLDQNDNPIVVADFTRYLDLNLSDSTEYDYDLGIGLKGFAVLRFGESGAITPLHFFRNLPVSGFAQWAPVVSISDLEIGPANEIVISGYYTGKFIFTGDSTKVYGNQDEFGGFICRINSIGLLNWMHVFVMKSTSQFSIAYFGFNDIAINKQSKIFGVGIYSDSMDFDPSSGVRWLVADPADTFPGKSPNVFLVKYDSSGILDFAISPENTARCQINWEKIHLDFKGNVIIPGCVQRPGIVSQGLLDLDPDTSRVLLAPGPSSALRALLITYSEEGKYKSHFLLRDPYDGQSFIDNSATITHVETDSAGNMVICGGIAGSLDVDPGPGNAILTTGFLTNGGSANCFIAKYTKTNSFLWGRYLGGKADNGRSSAGSFSLSGNKIQFTGRFTGKYYYQFAAPNQSARSYNFDSTALIYNNPYDCFFSQYSQCISRTKISDTICFGSTKTFDGEQLRKSGKYIRLKSYNTANQCEVWEELNLYVRPMILASAGKDRTICAGQNLVLGGDSVPHTTYIWQETSGSFSSNLAKPVLFPENSTDTVITHRYQLQATDQATGCIKKDSVVIQVSPRPRSYIQTVICQGDRFLGYDSAGIFTDTLISANGCDSVRTIEIGIKPARSFSQSISLCKGQTVSVGNRIYSMAGLYKDTLTAANGCDSIVTSAINIVQPNDSIFFDGTALMAAGGQDSYQWLDCSQNFQPVPGSLQQSFSPSENGTYAVTVTKGNCRDTSNCYLFTSNTIRSKQSIRIFPQPARDKLYVTLMGKKERYTFTMKDALGRIVLKGKGVGEDDFDTSRIPVGFYIFQLQFESTGNSFSSLIVIN